MNEIDKNKRADLIVKFGIIPAIVIVAFVGYVLLRYMLTLFPLLIVGALGWMGYEFYKTVIKDEDKSD